MKEQDKIISDIAAAKKKDVRVIQNIVYHPLLFTKHKMADPDDYRPIRIRYFGVFAGKYMRNKQNMQRLSFIRNSFKENPELFKIFIDPDTEEQFFPDNESAIKYTRTLFDSNRRDEFNELYEAVDKAIKTQ